MSEAAPTQGAARATWEVFWRFLLLGCVSFGGPAAHIGYFRRVFVERLGWLEDAHFARLLALCQFLPGPGSSQLGFAIGRHRAGPAGAVAAFLGFSLPSFGLMYGLAVGGFAGAGGRVDGVIHGLKLLAVVVVADACWQMYRSYCRQRFAAGIALIAAVFLLAVPGAWSQYAVLVLAAIAGALLLRSLAPAAAGDGGRPDWWPLGLFALLFLLLPQLVAHSPWLDLLNDFYQAGSLVFGGGHVVLPLLQESLGASLPRDTFLLGYATAQAVPGPMFSLSAFLGAELAPQAPAVGALLAVTGIFLPGFLLVLSLQGHWEYLAAKPRIAGAVGGINAAVVGLLLSALYQPVFVTAVADAADMALVVLGVFALAVARLPVAWLVLAFALAGAVLG
ncbi:chromate efflux transporter [Parahaliea mediterranea]|uniref:chromate efflux transporter n=1 Tax=Parahaliea mediterranea TaxID=651086 RepID=UPI001F49A7D8|nr:chromate efflux transporter [Parahaliea mediterranea]